MTLLQNAKLLKIVFSTSTFVIKKKTKCMFMLSVKHSTKTVKFVASWSWDQALAYS